RCSACIGMDVRLAPESVFDLARCTHPDTCSGTDGTCVSNNELAGTDCGDAEAECVNQDECDGAGGCTDNGFKSATTACGSQTHTECDNPHTHHRHPHGHHAT